MEREVASVVYLSATLIAIAALLSIVMFTVIVGRSVQSDFYVETSELVTSTETSQLKSLSMSDMKIMPMAAAYSIISKEYNGVHSIKYYEKVAGTNTLLETNIEPGAEGWEVTGAYNGKYSFPQDFFTNKLSGKVEVFVEYDRIYSTYKMTITKI